MDVAQITEHVHCFMIADQCMDSATRVSRLLFELAQQLDHPISIWPAIREITNLNQMGVTRNPVAPAIDQLGLTQNLNKTVVISVNVPYRYNSADTQKFRLCEDRRRAAKAGTEQGNANEVHDDDGPSVTGIFPESVGEDPWAH
jgi:hypothetical protein